MRNPEDGQKKTLDITQAFPEEHLARTREANLRKELTIAQLSDKLIAEEAAPVQQENRRIEDVAKKLLQARLDAGETPIDIIADARHSYLKAMHERKSAKASAEHSLTREAMIARRILQDLGYNLADLDAELVDLAAGLETAIPSQE